MWTSVRPCPAGTAAAAEAEAVEAEAEAAAEAAWEAAEVEREAKVKAEGRGLHSLTFQLNLSAFHGIGGARRGRVAHVKGVFRVCKVFLCVRHGSS